jgi:hypothetical protein
LFHLQLFLLSFGFRLAAPVVRQLIFSGSGTELETGEWLKPALPLVFNASQKSFSEIGRKIACQEGQNVIFEVSN